MYCRIRIMYCKIIHDREKRHVAGGFVGVHLTMGKRNSCCSGGITMRTERNGAGAAFCYVNNAPSFMLSGIARLVRRSGSWRVRLCTVGVCGSV
jgi:hypothetical protein